MVKAHLAPLELACNQYEVDAFPSTLQSLLAYLSYVRARVPPQNTVEFAQDSASAAETDMEKDPGLSEGHVCCTLD